MISARKNLERQNLTALIGEKIADELMAGDLLPGQALILREVAEQFGVSQTPVREALLQLVSEGALEMSPSRSVHVPQASLERLNELRELRVLIECYAGRQATKVVTAELINELHSIHKTMMLAVREEKYRDVLILNKTFHLTLYEQAAMPTTMSIIRQLWMRMAPYLNYLYSPNRPDRSLTANGHPHEMVLAGLEKRDPELVHQGLELDLRYLQKHLNDNLSSVS